MAKKIWLSSPHMCGREQKYVEEAFDTGWIAPLGANVDGLENDISAYLSVADTAVLTSGTAAIHLGLLLLGVSPGDEVICQSFTFSASANPITYCGATPVFVDSEPETWNMCPSALELAIRERLALGKTLKAIIPVHLYGMPAKMEQILTIADQYGIPVLEDAAEALGSRIGTQMAGTFGKVGVLSFNGNKIITTSGGGALVSDDTELTKKARFLATQARDDAPHYQHSHIGYNYRLSNVLAGIGRGQMEILPSRIDARRSINQRYRRYFGSIDGVSFQDEPATYHSNYWLTGILINSETAPVNREELRLALTEANIESRPLWKPMHLQPIFQGSPYYGATVCEKLFTEGLCLPSGSNLKDEDFERIFSALDSVLK